MKRILSVIAIMLVFTSGSAFAAALGTAGGGAATTTSVDGPTIYGGADATAAAAANAAVLGRLSKGVQIGVNYTNAAYSLTTKHKTGSKLFGTSYNSTSIYSQDSSSGTDVTGPTANDSAAFTSGWTAM